MDPANISVEQMNTLLTEAGWTGDPVTVVKGDPTNRNASDEYVYQIVYGSTINRVYVGTDTDGDVYVDNASMT